MATARHRCVYFGCFNSQRSNKDISFFKFPVKEMRRMKEWQQNCGNIAIALLDAEELIRKVICEKHFSSSDLIVSGKRKLLVKSSIPIKHLPNNQSTNTTDSEPALPCSNFEDVGSGIRTYSRKRTHESIIKDSETLPDPPEKINICLKKRGPNSPDEFSSSPTEEPSSNMSEACRTCLRLINIDKSPFYEIEADDMQVSEESCRYKLLSIVPEMALNITPKSMLCDECHWSVQAFFEFKKKCLKTENIIARYFQINLDLDSKNLDLKEVSAFNAADIKICENKFVEVFVKEEVELSDTAIVKHEVDNLSLESVEEARLKNQDLGSLADTRFTEDEAPIEEDCGLPEKSDPTIQERIHTDEHLYICSVCGKGYPSNSKLVIHMRNHTGEKPYRCEICDSQFTAKNHLTYHLRTHTGEKPYRCETCDRSFTHKWNFKTHLRIHTGERPHVCTVCGKGFAQKYKLTIHMRTHSNEKLYLCEICNRRFLEKYNLTAHLRTHTGEWPYVCGVCGKGFSINSKLLVHMRSHTGEKPYGCKICDQQFTIKQDLNVHLRKHTGERPYRCEKCDRGFTRKSLLTNHLRIHSGELPYFCTMCGQGYSSSFNLKEHTCTNDKEKPDQYNENSNPGSTLTVSSANTAKSSSGAAAYIDVHYENA